MAEATTGVSQHAHRAASCARCGADFDCSPKGVIPRTCVPCRRALHTEYVRRRRGVRAQARPDLCCCDCDAEIERKPGRGATPKRCRPCAAERDRAHVRTWRSRQPPAATECICEECAERFPRRGMDGPIPKRCPTCTADRARRLSRDYQRSVSLRRYMQSGRWSSCDRCSARIPLARKGPKARHCQHCWRTIRIEAYWAGRGKTPNATIPCADCGAGIMLHRKGTSRKRCSSCAVARQEQQSRAWWRNATPEHRAATWRQHKHRRRAAKRGAGSERFSDREIFVRDRWTCQICGKKVDPFAKWPNQSCASIDHIVPISQGGAHSRANTRLAHWICNSVRGDRGGNEQLALIG